MTGTGTLNDPYIITTPTDLQDVNNDLAGYYEIANDLDMTGMSFTPIAGSLGSPFTGTLDGNGYTISNLTITLSGLGPQRGSLIVYFEGTLKSIKLVDVNISATATPSGAALAGGIVVEYDSGNITDCSVTGTITAVGTSYVWACGFSPYVDNDATGATVSRCSTDCTVSATSSAGSAYAGGFTYDNAGNIENCYSRSNVTVTAKNSARAAGFAVYSESTATITNCYSTGTATVVSGAVQSTDGFTYTDEGTTVSSYWDTESSGLANSDSGTGETTAAMKLESTFTGWNFTTVWTLDSGNDGYPRLLELITTTPQVFNKTSTATTINTQNNVSALEAMRNIEMTAMGRIFIDKAGNLTYKSRYARNP